MKLSNPYLLIALLAVGIGLYALVPALFPFLLLGGCLLMHLAMHGGHNHQAQDTSRTEENVPQGHRHSGD
jgi:hypothetical protein